MIRPAHPLVFSALLSLASGAQAQAAASTTWSTQTGLPIYYQGVHFSSETNGVAVGEGAGYFSRTVNGGKEWTMVAVTGAQNTYAVHFPTATHGYAVGTSSGAGAIFKTTDGGATWTFKAAGGSATLFGVRFADANTGYAVGNAGTILKTTDGGATWVPQTNGAGPVVLNGIHIFSATHVIVAGEGGKILKTTDGGATWSPLATPGVLAFKAVHFTHPDTGYIVGSAYLFKTKDGGATWQPKTYGSQLLMNSIQFTDGKTGYIAGEYGVVYKTEDAGDTWKAVTTPSNSPKTLKSITFPSAGTGFAVGQSGLILKTGGATSAARKPGMEGEKGILLKAHSRRDHLSLEVLRGGAAVAEVLDLQGRALAVFTLSAGGNTFPTTSLKPGTYLLKVRSGASRESLTFTKL